VINPLDLIGCYSSGSIKPLSIFNELCLDDQGKTFYKKGDQSHANFAESFILIDLFIIILVICIIFDSLYIWVIDQV